MKWKCLKALGLFLAVGMVTKALVVVEADTVVEEPSAVEESSEAAIDDIISVEDIEVGLEGNGADKKESGEELTVDPTEAPKESSSPTANPTGAPKESSSPTANPTEAPKESSSPTANPTEVPKESSSPTANPTEAPKESSSPTANPTGVPEESSSPTESAKPSPNPSESPRSADGADTGSVKPIQAVASGFEEAAAKMLTGWVVKEEKLYWFEEGVQLGLEGDGQEIFDPDSEGWYWLDGSAAGAMALNKEVFLDSDGGKKVYYGEDGRRVGGEVTRDGQEYYYEPVTGAMVKGPVILSDGRKVFYDLETGAMVKGEYEINGKVYYFNEETGNKESETDLAADGSAESEAGTGVDGSVESEAGTEADGSAESEAGTEADGSAESEAGAEGGLVIETDEEVGNGTEAEADGSQNSTTGTEAVGSQESTAGTEAVGKPESTAAPEMAENQESTAGTEAVESPESECNTGFWLLIDGEAYWYVDWTRQGWKPELPDYEGEEIYDAASDAWYWLDGRAQGRMASDKLVYLETQADKEGTIGKWVYYGADGRRLKGWSEDKMYYFDPVYGTRAKGTLIIGNTEYVFDEETGMKLSEKLIAGFEAFGLTCKAEAGREYQYVTAAEKGVPVVGTAVFDYQTFVSDETHAEKEGYEWRQATVTIAFDSWWAQSFGAQYAVLYGLDYYNFKNVDVEELPGDIPEEADEIEIDGEKYQIFDSFEVLGSGWDENEVAHVTLRYECQVPVDYDGMVIAIYDAGNVGKGTKVLDRLDERSLLFRMK